jgi:hypothetical protein
MIVSVVSDGCIIIVALGTIREMMNRKIHNIITISKKKIRINKYFLLS